MNIKLDNMIGLCTRSGKIAFGSELSAMRIRCGKAKICVLATDASLRTKKLIHDKCMSFNVTCIEYGTLEHLGHITGKRSVSALAVCDKEFASAILKIYGGGLNGKSK